VLKGQHLQLAPLVYSFYVGQITKMDLCTVSQGSKQSYSFLAQVLGLMAELDFGEQGRFTTANDDDLTTARHRTSEMGGRTTLHVRVFKGCYGYEVMCSATGTFECAARQEITTFFMARR
jgi:hypothetical protein